MLAVPIWFDIAGQIITPDKWFKMRLTDYASNRSKICKANNKLIVELSKQSSLLIDTDGIYFSTLPNGKPPLLKFAPGFCRRFRVSFPKEEAAHRCLLILVVDTVRVSRFSINKREKNFFQYEKPGLRRSVTKKAKPSALKRKLGLFQRAPAY